MEEKSLEYSELSLGEKYLHTPSGNTCTLLAPHPHDGCCLIVSVYDELDDDDYLTYCERHDLKRLTA